MNIYTPLKSDFVFRNMLPFKKISKAIRVKKNLTFIDEIFKRANDLGQLLHKNISLEQVSEHQELTIKCEIVFDFGIKIWGFVGSGFMYGVSLNNDEIETIVETKENFIKLTENVIFNETIKLNKFILTQNVNNLKSEFNVYFS